MIAALALLRSPLAKWAGIALAVVAVALGLRHSGVLAERHRWEAKAAKAAQQARKTEAKGASVAADLSASNTAEQVRIEYRTKTLIEKVHDYVPHEVDCPVPAPAVGLLNAAVSGSEVPPAASGPEQAAPGVATSDLLRHDIETVGVAQQALSEARTWREWYAREAAIYGLRGPVDIPLP